MSKLDKIKAELAKLLVKYAVVKTDNGILEYEGEDLTAGMDVYVTNEEGERVAPENGEYVTEDGKVITVENGKVISIVDTKAEVDNEVAEEPKDETAEPETEEVKAEEEQPTEEPRKEDTTVAIEEIRKEINELYKLVDSILEKIGETRDEADARLSKLEKMSLAKPVTEEFEQLKETKKSGNSKLDKFLSNYGK